MQGEHKVKEEPDKKTKVEFEKKSAPAEKKQKKNVAKERTKDDKEAVSFPVDSRINAYGFVFLKMDWLKALGWHKGMALKIDKNADGSITIRKA